MSIFDEFSRDSFLTKKRPINRPVLHEEPRGMWR